MQSSPPLPRPLPRPAPLPITARTVITRDNWRSYARCLGMDTNLFYPEPPEGSNRPDVADLDMARRVCNGTREVPGCPVRSWCRAHARETGEPHGVWGGESSHQRRRSEDTRDIAPSIAARRERDRANDARRRARARQATPAAAS